MKTVTVTKELKFCAAHRLLGYAGPCKNIHGHNYRALITVARQPASAGDSLLGRLDMVIDFNLIKQGIQKWIDNTLDHALIINSKDTTLINFAESLHMKNFLTKGNPTAETFALIIMDVAKEHFSSESSGYEHTDKYHVTRVQVYETDTSFAEVTDD